MPQNFFWVNSEITLLVSVQMSHSELQSPHVLSIATLSFTFVWIYTELYCEYISIN